MAQVSALLTGGNTNEFQKGGSLKNEGSTKEESGKFPSVRRDSDSSDAGSSKKSIIEQECVLVQDVESCNDTASESDTDCADLEFPSTCVPTSEMSMKRRAPSRVTFRSRVRITSGFNRHRRQSSERKGNSSTIPGFSPDTSRSCSPSSSISAPLRFHSEEPVVKPGWGTLGQRVSLLAQRNAHKRQRAYAKMQERTMRSLSGPCFAAMQANETTALLGPSASLHGVPYVCQCERCLQNEHPESSLHDDWTAWLLDYHGWWTSIQQIVACKCLGDSDEE